MFATSGGGDRFCHQQQQQQQQELTVMMNQPLYGIGEEDFSCIICQSIVETCVQCPQCLAFFCTHCIAQWKHHSTGVPTDTISSSNVSTLAATGQAEEQEEDHHSQHSIQSTQCPHCRNMVDSFVKNRTIDQLVGKLLTLCTNGCGIRIARSEMANHIDKYCLQTKKRRYKASVRELQIELDRVSDLNSKLVNENAKLIQMLRNRRDRNYPQGGGRFWLVFQEFPKMQHLIILTVLIACIYHYYYYYYYYDNYL